MLKSIVFLALIFAGQANALDKVEVKSSAAITASTSTSGTVALAANKYRKWLNIRNPHATEALYVHLTLSTGVSASDAAVKVAAGETWEPKAAPIGAIYLFTSGVDVDAVVTSAN